MKIGQKKSTPIVARKYLWPVALLVFFVVGVALGERGAAGAMGDYWTVAASRFSASGNGDTLPRLTIDMPFENYNLLLAQRDEALETAVVLADESDFLTADVQLADQTIPIRLRLRQGTAVHLGSDEKWNFDIRTRNDRQLLGMSRFYLIDPADNNWLNEWAFMQALRREGILAPRYQFVHLIFNGDDWGLYALQEGFGAELMSNQSRPEGVVVEFDAARLWESSVYMGSDGAAADPVANLAADDFRYFEVDAFRDAAIARDEALTAQKNEAIRLLRGLQTGELAAADVFDLERYGRFLALADLWGADQAVSLLNLRYYYHPESGKLEPIGFNGAPVLDDPARRISLAAAYDDTAVQTAYAIAAERFSQPEYLTALQTDLEADWQTQAQALQAQALGEEIPLLPPWEPLAERQELLRRSLNPLYAVLAYLGPSSLSTEAIIRIDVANVLNLPVEIVGFDIDGAAFLEADSAWLQGQPFLADAEGIVLPGVGETAALQFARFDLPLAAIMEQNDEIDFNRQITISVAARILGREQTHLTPAAPTSWAEPTR